MSRQIIPSCPLQIGISPASGATFQSIVLPFRAASGALRSATSLTRRSTPNVSTNNSILPASDRHFAGLWRHFPVDRIAVPRGEWSAEIRNLSHQALDAECLDK